MITIKGTADKTNKQYTWTKNVRANETVEIAAVDTEEASHLRLTYDWTIGSNALPSKYLYHLPFPPNSTYLVSQGFNGQFSHQGTERYSIDFAMPFGSAVCAARDGKVIDIESQQEDQV